MDQIDARSVFLGNDFVILDTETTGLNQDAEICQIAILDGLGEVLLNSLVRPSYPIPAAASAVHGIKDDHVTNAPTWEDIVGEVTEVLRGMMVFIYNAKYDIRMLRQSHRLAGLGEFPKLGGTALCVMERYARYVGEWDNARGHWAWHSLSKAASRFGIETKGAHSALVDCYLTLGVMKGMWANED